MKQIDIAISPCPNDTFSFHALLFNYINSNQYTFKPYLLDIDSLNTLALNEKYTISKMSYYAYLKLKHKYRLFNAGSALGRKCGPLLISREQQKITRNTKIAIPGKLTTAYLLLRLWSRETANIVEMRFDRIIPALLNGTIDAGLIIHEGRFLYRQYHLHKLIDLGEWWESVTGCPIPLGCIAIKKASSTDKEYEELDELIKQSIVYALHHPKDSLRYVKKNATELDDTTIKQHIELYVNDFSIDLGNEGHNAIKHLKYMMEEKGIE